VGVYSGSVIVNTVIEAAAATTNSTFTNSSTVSDPN
jgi:hypothetical protein